MGIEHNVETAIKLLKFLGFEIEEYLKQDFVIWYEYKQKVGTEYPKEDSELEKFISIEDFLFLVKSATAYQITYYCGSKNLDRKYLASKSADEIMKKAAESELYKLLRSGVKIDDLEKFYKQNPQLN